MVCEYRIYEYRLVTCPACKTQQTIIFREHEVYKDEKATKCANCSFGLIVNLKGLLNYIPPVDPEFNLPLTNLQREVWHGIAFERFAKTTYPQ